MVEDALLLFCRLSTRGRGEIVKNPNGYSPDLSPAYRQDHTNVFA